MAGRDSVEPWKGPIVDNQLKKRTPVVTWALEFGNRSRSILCRNIAV